MEIGIGTCIVGILTSEQLTFGADSLRSYQNGKQEHICKIVQARKIFFTSSGLSIHSESKFSIQSLCRTAIKKGKTIDKSIKILEKIARQPLLRVYKSAFAKDQHYFNSVIKENPVSVAIFGLEEKKLILRAVAFKPIEENGRIAIHIKRTDFKGEEGDEASICLGCPSVIDLAWSPTMPDPQVDPVAYIKYAINWAIAHEAGIGDGKKLIGGPIDILRVSKQGSQWIQKKAECP